MNRYAAPPDLLKDRIIMVTGAGQGIGRVAAKTFASYGATVVLHGRDERKLIAVYDEIEAAGHPVPAAIPLDFLGASDAQFEALADSIRKEFGRLDGVLHNAVRFDALSPLSNQDSEQWSAALKINLLAPVALTRALTPLLVASPDASVVVTSETHGHAPCAYWGAFAVSKAALEAWARVQADEWEMYPQLRVNVVVPGAVHSPSRMRSHPAEDKFRLATPEDLMPSYLFLIGPASRGLSGHNFICRPDRPLPRVGPPQ
jgi:NAD(P)-dependent dehydrogenase (short-subunit alcohol dehydrogenase family)